MKPEKEKARPGNSASLRKTAQGRDGKANDSATALSAQAEPEHRNDRRRFLIWALMAGYTKPERVVERIVAEVEATP